LFFLGCAWGLCGVLSLGFFWFVGGMGILVLGGE
jgi:hypothetical protein